MPATHRKKVPPNLLNLTEMDHLPAVRRLRVEILTNSKGYLELNLNKRDLQIVPPETFQLTATQVLRLAHNHIDYLPMMVSYLRALRVLDMQFNLLGHLPETLVNCRHLAELLLMANRLTELPKSIGGLKKLRVLTLGENQFEQLPQEVGQLTNLRVLDLHSNKLWQLPFSLQELKHLLRLNISDNMFDHVPLVVTKITSLQALNLSRNRLVSLPVDFDGLKGLRELNLSHNKFVSISSMLVTLRHLKYLSLASNGLKFLPSHMVQLQNLKVLHLQDNSLRYVPSKLRRLRYYNVSRNQLASLSVEGMRNLVSLTASCNKLESPPRGLHKLKQLKFLYLDNNCLVELGEDVALLHGLQLLDLSNNDLLHLPCSLYTLSKLQSLNIRGNHKLTRVGVGKGGQDKKNPLKFYPSQTSHGSKVKEIDQHKILEITKMDADKTSRKVIKGEVSTKGKMDFDKEDDESIHSPGSEQMVLGRHLQQMQNSSSMNSNTDLQDRTSRSLPEQKSFTGNHMALMNRTTILNPQKPVADSKLPMKNELNKKSHSLKSLKNLLPWKSKKSKSAELGHPPATTTASNSIHLPLSCDRGEAINGTRRNSTPTRQSVMTRNSVRTANGWQYMTDIDDISLMDDDQRSYRTNRGTGKKDVDEKSHSLGYGSWASRGRSHCNDFDKPSYRDDNHARNQGREIGRCRVDYKQNREHGASLCSYRTDSDIVYIPFHRDGRQSKRAPLFCSGKHTGSDAYKNSVEHTNSHDENCDYWYYNGTSSPDYTIGEAYASFATESSPRHSQIRSYSHTGSPRHSLPSNKRETRSLTAPAKDREAHLITQTTPSQDRYRKPVDNYQPYFNDKPAWGQPSMKSGYHPHQTYDIQENHVLPMRSCRSDSMLNSSPSPRAWRTNPALYTNSALCQNMYTSRERLFDHCKSDDASINFNAESNYRYKENGTEKFGTWVHGSGGSLRSTGAGRTKYPSHIRSHSMILPQPDTGPYSSAASYISDYVDYTEDPFVDQISIGDPKNGNTKTDTTLRPIQQSFSQFDHVLSTKDMSVREKRKNQSNMGNREKDTPKYYDDNFSLTKKRGPSLVNSRSMDSLINVTSLLSPYRHPEKYNSDDGLLLKPLVYTIPHNRKYLATANIAGAVKESANKHKYDSITDCHSEPIKKSANQHDSGRADYILLGVCNQIETMLNKNVFLDSVTGSNINGSHRFSEKMVREKPRGLRRIDSKANLASPQGMDEVDAVVSDECDDDGDDGDDGGGSGHVAKIPALEYSQPQVFTLTSSGGRYISRERPKVTVDVPPHAVSKTLHVTIQLLFIAPALLDQVKEFNNFVDNILEVGPVVYFHPGSNTSFNSQATITIPAPASSKGDHLIVLTIGKDNSCIPCNSAFRSGKFAVTLPAWHFNAKVALLTKAKCKYKACKSMERLLQGIGANQI